MDAHALGHVRQNSLHYSNISTGASSTPESLGSAPNHSNHQRVPSSTSKIFIPPPPPPPLLRHQDSSSSGNSSLSPAITTPNTPHSPSHIQHSPSTTHSRSPSTSSAIYTNTIPPPPPSQWNSPHPNATHARQDSYPNPSHSFQNASFLAPGSFSPSQLDRGALAYSPNPSVVHHPHPQRHQRHGTAPDVTSIHSSSGIGPSLLVPLPSSRPLVNSASLHHAPYHPFNAPAPTHYDTGIDKQAYQQVPSTTLPPMDPNPNLSARYKSPPPLPHPNTQSQNTRQHSSSSSIVTSWPPPPPPPLMVPITKTTSPTVRTPSPLDHGPFPSSSVPPANMAVNTAPPRPPKPPELMFGNSGQDDRRDGHPRGSTSRTTELHKSLDDISTSKVLALSGRSSEGQSDSSTRPDPLDHSDRQHPTEQTVGISTSLSQPQPPQPSTILSSTIPLSSSPSASTSAAPGTPPSEADGMVDYRNGTVDASAPVTTANATVNSTTTGGSETGHRRPETSAAIDTTHNAATDNHRIEIGGDEEEEGVEVDARSDSGMTMESYDPRAFDFPRMVNDNMVHVLSPTIEEEPQEMAGSTINANARRDANAAVFAMDEEQEAPPTYDQAQSEFLLEAQQADGATTTTSVLHITNASVVASRGNSEGLTTPNMPPPAFQSTVNLVTNGMLPGGSNAVGASPVITRSGKHAAMHLAPISPTPHSDAARPSTSHHEDRPTSHPNASQPTSSSRPKSAHAPHPEIYTSPATPSPSHSPSRASPNHSKSFRMSISRRFTMSSNESPASHSPSSERGDPFQDPPTFQSDASPFAAQQTDDELCSPIESKASMTAFNGPQTSPTDQEGSNNNRAYWNRNRSRSGVMSNMSSTPPTPRSELGSDEIPRRIEDYAVPRVSTSSSHATHSLAPPSVDKGKGKKKVASGNNGSRLSLFFRSPVPPPPPAKDNTSTPRDSVSLHSQQPASRRGGLDLLDDGASGEGEFGQAPPLDHRSSSRSGGVQVLATSEEVIASNQLSDLWEGVEFGFRAPNWNAVPTPGPFSNPSEWPENVTLYPIGSDPFFVRAPTWRSLLRFLASQSNTRIEPSVEALALSRTPTMDLRLVVQFARNPFTPRGTTRDICLYMLLHSEMPAVSSKNGRTVSWTDRGILESWDTKALPYGFRCAEKSMLCREKRSTQAAPQLLETAGESPSSASVRGTPCDEQDPDGENSMFVTLPPPFIRLPVTMSDLAMYLHESLVQSRKNGKGGDWFGPNLAETSQATAGPAKIKKSPNQSLPPAGAVGSLGLVVSTTPRSTRVDDTTEHAQSEASNIPGMKRLAKAVKTFYPEEFAIGSSKSNRDAAHAAVEDPSQGKSKTITVSSLSGRNSFLSAFHLVRSKGTLAKNAIAGDGGGLSGNPLGVRRDTNAERYELVTPWRQSTD